jgi:hypothetical protein
MNTNLHKSNRWNVHLLLAVAGMTGIAGLFLPFYWDVSPMKALFDKSLWQLAAPALLSVLITVANIRWIISSTFSKAEKVIAFIISLAAAVITLSILYNGNMWPFHFRESFIFLIPQLVLLSGAFFVLRKHKKQVLWETNPLIALQVPYIANCWFCLAMFWPSGSGFLSGDWEIGAYFCLAASIVYLIQIVLFLTQKNEISDQAEVSNQ